MDFCTTMSSSNAAMPGLEDGMEQMCVEISGESSSGGKDLRCRFCSAEKLQNQAYCKKHNTAVKMLDTKAKAEPEPEKAKEALRRLITDSTRENMNADLAEKMEAVMKGVMSGD